MNGRRREDVKFGTLPNDLQPGDYWKYLNQDGEPLTPVEWHGGTEAPSTAGNLTKTVWGYYSPDGRGAGTLVFHTVRENEDGTITVAPGDGSSNSILHTHGRSGDQWHGYIDHGRWYEA